MANRMKMENGGHSFRRMLIGTRIRRLRAEHSLSAKSFGNMLGIKEAQVYRIERGEVALEIAFLAECAKIFNLSKWDDLCGDVLWGVLKLKDEWVEEEKLISKRMAKAMSDQGEKEEEKNG